MTLQEINDLPILSVLDKLGVGYKRESSFEYCLQRQGGEFANGRKANIVKNIVGDFSHGEAGGKVFGFVMDFMKLTKEETFERFDLRFSYSKAEHRETAKQDQKPITQVRNTMTPIDEPCKKMLSDRYIDPDKVKDVIRGCQGGIACLLYQNNKPIGCNIRTTSTEHAKRFRAVPGYSTDGIYQHNIDKSKDYLIVVEGMFDFLTIRQFDTNVVGLKSNKSGFEEIQRLSKNYKIYFIPDNDDAGAESLGLIGLDDYYLFDLGSLGQDDIKDVNDLACCLGGAELLTGVIFDKSQHIVKEIEHGEDGLMGYDAGIYDRLNLTNPLPFTFGLPKIDKIRGKFDYNQLHAIIGESGSGKTTFSFFQALQNSKTNKVLYVSLEMQPEKLISLRARKMAGIDAEHRSNKTFSPTQATVMKKTIEEVESNKNLKVVGCSGENTIHIDSVIKSIERYVRLGFGLIYIDNLGFVEGSGSNNREKINDVIRKCQKFVQSNKCTIVLIHHFTKGDKRSRLDRGFADVMDTAKLEHDISYGLFVSRDMDDYGDQSAEERATTYISVKKDRENGLTGRVPIFFKSGGYEETYNP